MEGLFSDEEKSAHRGPRACERIGQDGPVDEARSSTLALTADGEVNDEVAAMLLRELSRGRSSRGSSPRCGGS